MQIHPTYPAGFGFEFHTTSPLRYEPLSGASLETSNRLPSKLTGPAVSISAVGFSTFIPNLPFTEERKGMFDEFMNFIFPPAQASTLEEPSVLTQEVVEEAKPMSFGDTFKQARADGLDTFSFKGKEYTTEVAQ